MTKITFSSNGYALAANLFIPKNKSSKLAFLLIQGWNGHQNIHTAQALAELGHTAMTYDMRGNGESQGSITDFSRADFVSDAANAYDFFGQRLPNDMKMGVIGSSFGCYTAVLLSEERAIDYLSLRVPANYPDEGFKEPQAAQLESTNDFKVWRQKKLTYGENKALLMLHNFKGKIQIIEAGADEIVPSQVLNNYANAVMQKRNLTYEIMPEAPHRLENEKLQSDYERRLIAWIKSLHADL